jgi:hypothetical protein
MRTDKLSSDDEINHDKSLSFGWVVPEAVLKALSLRPAGRHRVHTLRGILGAAVIAADAHRWVSYSRREGWYTGLTRYYGAGFTYSNIIAAIELLLQAGLIEEERAEPSSRSKWQSRFRASKELLRCPPTPSRAEQEPLRLRGTDGNLVGYTDTARTTGLRRGIREINEYLGSINLTLDAPGVTRTTHHWITEENLILLTPRPRVYRSFVRGSWNLGGRFYAFWQNLPKRLRAELRINGEPVARPDYKALHPSLIYAQAGLRMDHEPYAAGPGFSYDDCKKAFNIAINARTPSAAIWAIADHLNADRSRAVDLYDVIRNRHPGIQKCFGSDAGVLLMNCDASIMSDCLKACAKDSIPALCVHDELVVPQRNESRVREIMIDTFNKHVSPLSPCLLG